jgi:hypothetical protein
MEKRINKRTLKELFEFTGDAISGFYEVVRTIGFTLETKSGPVEYRLEAVKQPGKKLCGVRIWSRRANGAWEGGLSTQPTLERVHPDLALRSMVTYIRQHYSQY